MYSILDPIVVLLFRFHAVTDLVRRIGSTPKMKAWSISFLLAAVLLIATCARAFAPISSNFRRLIHPSLCRVQSRRQKPIFMVNQFDISRPVFDPLSLRNVRGDALVSYDALNQSEPLRISLYSLLALSLFAAPSLTEAVGYDEMSVPATIASYVLGVSSLGLLFRECTRRSKQLIRIEKELNTESLPIRIPTNLLSDAPFSRPTTLKELRNTSNHPPRIIAISGNKAKLDEALLGLSIFGRRLQQASAFVVVVPTDGSKLSDLAVSTTTSWLADAYNQAPWREYFQSLTDNGSASAPAITTFQWFGLNSRGRSFGSGQIDVPMWLQVLGRHLRPTDFLDESDDAFVTADSALLALVNSFYHSLTTGDSKGIESVFSTTLSPQVSEVIEAGGRIDSWKDCLVEGARPEGMKVSGVDTVFLSETEAYSTVIEFPPNAGIDSATLLAVQRWTRDSGELCWKLDLHQTIPWSPETRAQGTLRCDCRGCVALTGGPEKRTFGGIIG